MQVFRKIKKVALVILLPAVLILLANSILNRHNHIIHGYLYSHAHPFQKEAGSEPVKHTHTDIELLILDLLSSLEVIVGISLIVLSASEKLLKLLPAPAGITIATELARLGPPRAPPVFY